MIQTPFSIVYMNHKSLPVECYTIANKPLTSGGEMYRPTLKRPMVKQRPPMCLRQKASRCVFSFSRIMRMGRNGADARFNIQSPRQSDSEAFCSPCFCQARPGRLIATQRHRHTPSSIAPLVSGSDSDSGSVLLHLLS